VSPVMQQREQFADRVVLVSSVWDDIHECVGKSAPDPHGRMFPGREVKTNNIVTRETAVWWRSWGWMLPPAALSTHSRRHPPGTVWVVVHRKMVNKSKQWLFRDVGSGSIKPTEMWGRLRGEKFTTCKHSSSISQSSENQLPL
jgi:hypothetical protein